MTLEIGERYAEALRPFGEVDGPRPDTMGNVDGGFILTLTLPNGYGLSVARNGLSYGSECLAVLYDDKLLNAAPGGVGVPLYNNLILTDGPTQAVRVAEKLSQLSGKIGFWND